MIKTTLTGIACILILLACSEKPEPEAPKPKTAAPIPAAAITEFSGEKALEHIKKITAFGPRPAQSKAYQKTLIYLEEYLHGLGWKTRRNTFQALTPLGRVTFTNLLARYLPDGEPDWSTSPSFLVSGHLDTKKYNDKTFLGANDSGSSTGVMLELARVLSEHDDAALQVELVFFDGEEAMNKNIVFRKDGLYGSTNYAKNLLKRKTRPSLGIVLDLVGDHRVPLLIGGDSHSSAVAHSRTAVKTLGLEKAISFPKTSILDDHIPLMTFANLPVLHLIGEFSSMDYWHTDRDTLDQLSPTALENSGKLTLQVLHQMTN